MSNRETSTPQFVTRIAATSGLLLVILLIQSIIILNPAQHLSAAVLDERAQGSDCNASYQVQPGDTIGGVAGRSGTTSQGVRDCNDLSSDVVYAGQVLKLPKQINNDQNAPTTRVSRARLAPQTTNSYHPSNNGGSNGQRGGRPPQRQRP